MLQPAFPPLASRLLSLTSSVVLIAACGGEPTGPTGATAIPVRVATLAPAAIADSSEFVATLQAKERATVRAEIAGQIVGLGVSDGDRVEPGQPLLQINPDQTIAQVQASTASVNAQKKTSQTGAEAAVRTARAQLQASEANRDNAKAAPKHQEAELANAQANLALQTEKFKRVSFLVSEGVQSQQQLDVQKTNRDSAIAARTAATEAVNAAQSALRAAEAASSLPGSNSPPPSPASRATAPLSPARSGIFPILRLLCFRKIAMFEEPPVSPANLMSPPAPDAIDTMARFDAHVMNTYGRFPLAIARGQGCRLWDTDGREYLDFVAGIATCTLGHAHPALIAAVTQQIQTLHHVSNLYYIPQQGELAAWIANHSCADRVFFCNSGAEANEAAIKLARKYAHVVQDIDQPVILSAQASFHGRTLATVTATGQPKYQQDFDPLPTGFEYIPYNDIDALEAAVSDIDEGNRRVAAIILEPLQGEGGVNPGDLGYFLRVRKICDETGILLILDEVQVGMGRTGKLWGYENLGIEPDIFTSAKGLAGGIPIGAMACKKFCAVFEPGNHASTFGGNPFACAAALAVAATIERDDLLQNTLARGEQLRKHLRAIVQQYPHLFSEARGWGLINGLALQPDAATTASEIVKAALERGLLLVPAGSKVLRFVPPLIVSAAEVDRAAELLNEAIATLPQ